MKGKVKMLGKLIRVILFLQYCFFASLVFAADIAPPDQLGKYRIGYTEFHACDDNRVILVHDDPIFHSGGTLKDCVRGPVKSRKILVARPVGFRVWYPTLAKSGPSVNYSINNDIYPNIGVMATTLTTPSTYGALQDVPVVQNSNAFPLVIFSPGANSTGTEFATTFNEVLASHGFILVGLDHANSEYPGRHDLKAFGLYSYPTTGPFPSMNSAKALILKIDDIRFSIDEMLRRNNNIPQGNLFNGTLDQNKIGLQGYSLGGPASLGEAGGIKLLGITPDPRVKALFIMDGTLYGDPLRGKNSSHIFNFQTATSSDLANIKIPILLISNLNVPDHLRAFQDLGSNNVTLIRLSSPTHRSTAEPWCDTVKSRLDHIATATPLDLFVVQYRNFRGFEDNAYINCPAILFTNHSLAEAQKLLFSNIKRQLSSIYTMPLEMLDSELLKIERFYTVSFFQSNLAGNNQYKKYLMPEYAKNKLPLFVHIWHNTYNIPDHPLDLRGKDKITFIPIPENRYQVSYSKGNQMVPVDNTHTVLHLLDDDQALVPFNAGFPFLGSTFGNSSINNINVNTNGNITLGTNIPSATISNLTNPALSSNDELIGSGVYRIAPFFTDIEPGNPSGAVTYKETTDGRLIVTYTNVPRYPFDFDGLNLGSVVTTGTSTFQVILYGTTSSSPGKIEFIYGHLDPLTNSPDRIVATVGIAKGNAWTNYPIVPIGDKMGTRVNFSTLKQSITLPVGAIYETFTNGIDIKKK